MPGYEILEWDSHFFGFGVARILPRRLDSSALERILKDLRQQKMTLVYWSSDPEDGPTQAAAKNMEGFLADEKITYLIEGEDAVQAARKTGPQIHPYEGGWPNRTLERLAIESGIYSRFRVDSRIPEGKFEELYRIWMRGSVTGTLADEVLVQLNGPDIVGMVTLGVKSGRGDIGLIAVDTSARGRGVGENLVRTAVKWSLDQGLASAQVITQKTNAAACRLYEKCGYRIERVDNLYHFWLQVPSP